MWSATVHRAANNFPRGVQGDNLSLFQGHSVKSYGAALVRWSHSPMLARGPSPSYASRISGKRRSSSCRLSSAMSWDRRSNLSGCTLCSVISIGSVRDWLALAVTRSVTRACFGFLLSGIFSLMEDGVSPAVVGELYDLFER